MRSTTVRDLLPAVRGLGATPAGELVDAVVVEELAAWRALADAAEAAYLDRLRVFDARGLGEADGLSTRAWVRDRLHVAPGDTARALKLAHALVRFPALGGALTEGRLRVPHAVAIVDAESLLGHEVIAAAEHVLIAAAAADDPTRLRAALRGYGAAIDSPRAIKQAERRDQGRWLDLAATLDGSVAVQGVLGPEDGAIVKAAIESLTRPAGAEDTRSATQRRADALTELCRRQLDSGALPSGAANRPHLTVVTDLTTIEARIGGFGELPDGTLLRGETVRRLACDAKITRLVVGPDSQPLDVGRTQRTVTPAQHKALRVRDGGCRFPGCRRPVEWCDAHHVTFWSNGGRTNVDELLLLCRSHHTAVHEGRWTILTAQPGHFRLIDPNGEVQPLHRTDTSGALVAKLLALNDENPGAAPCPAQT